MKNGNVERIYIVDEKTAEGRENTYVYDERTDVVFKIPQTRIDGKIYHSYECATLSAGSEEIVKDLIVTEESIVAHVGNDYYYTPNMKGFDANKTYLIYYSSDFNTIEEIPVKEYIENGQLSQIEKDDKTYTLHNYGKKIWANAKTISGHQEAWWVWIPRYAYKINSSEKTMDIIYIGTDNKPLDTETYSDGKLPDGYVPHPGFTVEGKELKGLWMSKYEPSYASQTGVEGLLAPDMSGFDEDYTYIELYDSKTNTFNNEVLLKDADLNTINADNKWYDYKNKVWANIKTIADGKEAWWVWIPRYAYRIVNIGDKKETDIIFVDLNNNPINSEEYFDGLPDGYVVHPAFNVDGKKLKGIWMSKYEPSYASQTGVEGLLAPDMSGFDEDYTYIELYDSKTNTFNNEVLLKDADLNTINVDNKWYDYKNKVWANIKTIANGKEAWWVWIPRYAYKIINIGDKKEIDIIFIDLNNNPINSEEYPYGMPEGYIIHPAFNVDGKKLKGIWMSKYEPSKV